MPREIEFPELKKGKSLKNSIKRREKLRKAKYKKRIAKPGGGYKYIYEIEKKPLTKEEQKVKFSKTSLGKKITEQKRKDIISAMKHSKLAGKYSREGGKRDRQKHLDAMDAIMHKYGIVSHDDLERQYKMAIKQPKIVVNKEER